MLQTPNILKQILSNQQHPSLLLLLKFVISKRYQNTNVTKHSNQVSTVKFDDLFHFYLSFLSTGPTQLVTMTWHLSWPWSNFYNLMIFITKFHSVKTLTPIKLFFIIDQMVLHQIKQSWTFIRVHPGHGRCNVTDHRVIHHHCPVKIMYLSVIWIFSDLPTHKVYLKMHHQKLFFFLAFFGET